MPLLATALLHPVLAGLFISGAVAAMMSTADSQISINLCDNRRLFPSIFEKRLVGKKPSFVK